MHRKTRWQVYGGPFYLFPFEHQGLPYRQLPAQNNYGSSLFCIGRYEVSFPAMRWIMSMKIGDMFAGPGNRTSIIRCGTMKSNARAKSSVIIDDMAASPSFGAYFRHLPTQNSGEPKNTSITEHSTRSMKLKMSCFRELIS